MKVVSFVIGAAFKWLERSFCKTMEREEIFQMASFGVNQATEMGVVKSLRNLDYFWSHISRALFYKLQKKGETFEPTIFFMMLYDEDVAEKSF